MGDRGSAYSQQGVNTTDPNIRRLLRDSTEEGKDPSDPGAGWDREAWDRGEMVWTGRPTADSGGRGDWYQYAPGNSDFDAPHQSQFLPGWMEGESEERKNEVRDRLAWQDLLMNLPTVEDMSVNYEQLGNTDEYGNLVGGPSEISRQGSGEADQRQLRNALNNLVRGGGYTEADRSMQNAMAAQNAQQVGAMNQAAMRSAYGRGMGGGGAQLASMLSGSQGLASANAMNSAQMQQAAMNRLMQGYGMQGQLAGQMNSQQLARQQALDAYNQRQLDWRRQRSAQNTDLRNQTRESRSAARERHWEMQREGVGGYTGQPITPTNNPMRRFGQAVVQGVNAGAQAAGSIFGG